MTDIVEFLDGLTYGDHLPAEAKSRREQWRAECRAGPDWEAGDRIERDA